jgi:hypothetical protein
MAVVGTSGNEVETYSITTFKPEALFQSNGSSIYVSLFIEPYAEPVRIENAIPHDSVGGFFFAATMEDYRQKHNKILDKETKVGSEPPIPSNKDQYPKMEEAPTIAPTAAGKVSGRSKTGRIVIIDPEGCELRRSSSLNGDFIEMVPYNAECEVLDRNGGWFLIRTPTNTVGWLSGYGEVTGKSYIREIE